MSTPWGHHSLHEVLERMTWRPAQHVRQVAMLMARLGIVPTAPLTREDIRGLPLPERVQA